MRKLTIAWRNGRPKTDRWITLFLIGVAIATPATATSKKHCGASSKLIGQYQFEGEALVDMALTTGSGRRYLYVQHAQDEGVSLLDVSDPTQPKLLGTTFWPEGAELGGLTFLGDYAIGKMLPMKDNPATGREKIGFLCEGGDFQTGRESPMGCLRVKRAILDEGVLFILTDSGLCIVEAP